jgi:phosphoglycolate phosphatase-like HAD superfamily hydrolase
MGVRRRFILWDVDGTLVSAGPAARDAFDLAVAATVGRSPHGHGVEMSGKTDPQIAMEILAALELSEGEARGHLPVVLRSLEEELQTAADLVREHGRVMPGIGTLLPELHAAAGVVQSVLTGNLEANARLKVGTFGLHRWLDLDVGAYGSDDQDRSRLVPVALAKVRDRRGIRFEPGDVWVVGDTPLDLACARAGGARCLLVATGRFGFEELAGLGADAVLSDVTETGAVANLLLSDGEAGSEG